MRPKHPLLAAAGLVAALVLGSAARTQDGPFDGLRPYYWPHRSFGIPIDLDAANKQDPKPAHVQLYYSLARGPWEKGPKLPLTGLNDIDKGKKGIVFEAPKDGDYEFAAQYVYPDGSVGPRAENLAPTLRAVIDTVPPRVQIAPGGNGVEWRVTDENLDPAGITLEAKWSTGNNWTAVKHPNEDGGGRFKPADTYTWRVPVGSSLDVRVRAKDRAGHEGVSPVVRVPAAGAGGGLAVGLPKDGGPVWAGGTGALLPQPRIDYVNTLDFTVDTTVQRMGRSGVQAAHLFVLKERGDWERVTRHPVKLMPDDKGPHSLSLPYKAEREGTYGFFIIPESGAGKRAEDPRRDDPPMVLVVVDTTKPQVRITGVQVKPGGVRGPLVEFTWEASDANLMAQPVSLEWSLDKTADKWNEVKYRLDNTLTPTSGRFVWEVPDEKLWKFHVRARAVDKAANMGEHVWPQEVLVDLEKPQATIDRVRGGMNPGAAPPAAPPGKSDTPPP